MRHYKYLILIAVGLLVDQSGAQDLRYAPRWFGPNANPTPELQISRLPAMPTASIRVDKHWGGKSSTSSLYADIELPIVQRAASLRIYGYPLECYSWDREEATRRNIPHDLYSGTIVGDLYVQTRLRLLKEGRHRPNLILNATLKTASPKTVCSQRCFDTPGYFFLLETGKDLYRSAHPWLSRIRLEAYLGFLCWETIGSLQNDAPVYALNLLAEGYRWQCALEIGAYNGWQKSYYGEDFGDEPIISRLYLTYKASSALHLTLGWRAGWRDYPYTAINLGFSYTIPWDSARLFAR